VYSAVLKRLEHRTYNTNMPWSKSQMARHMPRCGQWNMFFLEWGYPVCLFLSFRPDLLTGFSMLKCSQMVTQSKHIIRHFAFWENSWMDALMNFLLLFYPKNSTGVWKIVLNHPTVMILLRWYLADILLKLSWHCLFKITGKSTIKSSLQFMVSQNRRQAQQWIMCIIWLSLCV